MRGRWYLFGAGLVFGTLLALFASRLTDPAAVRLMLSSVSPGSAVIIAIGIVAFLLLKSIRWRQLLRPLMARDVGDLFPAVALGSAANYVIPHIGELLRIWAIGRNGKNSNSAMLATIALERVLDVAAIGLAGMGLLLLEVHSPQLELAVQALAFGCGLCFVAIVVLLRYPTVALQWCTERFPRIVASRGGQWALSKLRAALEGLDEARSPVHLLQLLVLSVAQWACIAFCIGMSLDAAGLVPTLGANVAVLVLVVAGLVLPSAPGYVGTTQVAFLMALEPLGYDTDAAVAASVIYNVVIVAAIVAVALATLFWVRPRLWGAGPGA